MTEILGNNGYNGYIAGNPPPQLQDCGVAETNKDNFEYSQMSLYNFENSLRHEEYQRTIDLMK